MYIAHGGEDTEEDHCKRNHAEYCLAPFHGALAAYRSDGWSYVGCTGNTALRYEAKVEEIDAPKQLGHF